MLIPKPKHMGPEYAAMFKDNSVAEAYRYRPPYPEEVFDVLTGLFKDAPRTMLDVGCGTGDIARQMVTVADRVDAVDFSLAMIEEGKRLPNGDHPNLRWINSEVERANLIPPYALITAGESLHWLAWDIVFPRFVQALTPNGVIAIIERNWDTSDVIVQRLRPIFRQYALNRDYRPYNLIEELELRGLFDKCGEHHTSPLPWRPTIDEYIECRHSQNGLSRQRMKENAAAFDDALRQALLDLHREEMLEIHDGRLELEVEAKVTWGRPIWPFG